MKLLALAVAFLAATPCPGAESLDVEKDEGGLLLTEDGRRVLYYQRAPKSLDGHPDAPVQPHGLALRGRRAPQLRLSCYVGLLEQFYMK